MRNALRSLLLLGAGMLVASGWMACAPHPEEQEPPPQPAPAPAAQPTPESSTKPDATPPAQQASVSSQANPAAAPGDSGKKLSPEELQSLVAPVALYPDELLAQ